MARVYVSEGYWSSLLSNGLSKLLVLEALQEGPTHGYALARRIEVMSRGFCTPTHPAVYPALREFERDGCVRRHEEAARGRGRKVYALTSRGRQALRAGLTAWQRGIECLRAALARGR